MPAKIGLIGIGLVGTVLAEHFLANGLEVIGYDVDAERLDCLKRIGGSCTESPAEIAERVNHVVLSLPDTAVVREVIEGANGILRAERKPSYIIDTTTGDPDDIGALAEKLAQSQVSLLDATISGASSQLEKREAVFMVGGEPAAYEVCAGLLRLLAEEVFYVGPSGCGSKAKLATNLVLGLNRLVLAEGIVFAEKLGLPLDTFLRLLKVSPAYSVAVDVKGEKMLNSDFEPVSRIRQHHKDVSLILKHAKKHNQHLPLSNVHLGIMEKAIAAGDGGLDTSAVIKEIRREGSTHSIPNIPVKGTSMDKKQTHSRRSFLKNAVLTSAVLCSGKKVLGANDDIRVAIIGLGGKGRGHLGNFSKMNGVRIAGLCDVDPKRLDERGKDFKGKGAFFTTDARKIIERKDIDAVVIATCDHWHALLAVWACQAGKDVYVEKPVSHNILEGRRMIAAAKKYGRIMQSGLQYRSDEGLAEAAEYLQSGKLGKMLRAHVPWYELRPGIGRVDPYTPDWLDYDMYCGPGELKPLRRPELHYDWHWLWNTGTGDLGNSSVHAYDICRMMMGYKSLPPRAICVGGRFGVDDVGETPNTQLTLLDYDEAPVVVENRNLGEKKGSRNLDHVRGVREGIILSYEGGYFAGLRAGGWVYDNDGKKVKQFVGGGGGDHTKNFIRAVRKRDASILKAPIEEGHISSACCHLGNISYRLGAASTPDRIKAAIKSSDLAGKVLDSIAEHLDANEVDLSKDTARLGPLMTVDPTSEEITALEGHGTLARAKTLAHGTYREPYVMPEEV